MRSISTAPEGLGFALPREQGTEGAEILLPLRSSVMLLDFETSLGCWQLDGQIILVFELLLEFSLIPYEDAMLSSLNDKRRTFEEFDFDTLLTVVGS